VEEHRPTRRFVSGTILRLALALALVAAVAVPLAGPVTAQVTDEDIARAEAELAALKEELQVLTDEWEAAVARRVTIEQAVEDQSQRLIETTLSVSDLELRAEDRAAEMYMDAALSGLTQFLAPGSVEGAGAGIGYLDEVADADRNLITELAAQKAELSRQQDELGVAQADLDDAVDDLDANVSQIITKLGEAQERYEYLVEKQRQEEEARRRAAEEAARRAAEEAAAKAAAEAAAATSTTAGSGGSSGGGGSTATTAPPATTAPSPTTTAPPAPAPSTGGKVCPVAGATTFSDSWGAPRSGGRTHKGVDMLASRGTPIVAIEDGRISRLSTSSLGGITIYFTGNSGDYYYYAHLDSYASGISGGMRVSAGTVLGYNGSSGNAPAHIPHLHFQWAPGGGSWANPYPLVRPLC
jgi:septal ring factor EnvC (AmiA/AmiB activator)